MNGQKSVRSYDLETGKELWRCGGQTLRPIASPVAGNGLVIVGSGYQGAFLGAFHLDGTGDIQGTDKVVWELNHDTPDVASPLLSSGRLYFHKGKNGAAFLRRRGDRQAALFCPPDSDSTTPTRRPSRPAATFI